MILAHAWKGLEPGIRHALAGADWADVATLVESTDIAFETVLRLTELAGDRDVLPPAFVAAVVDALYSMGLTSEAAQRARTSYRAGPLGSEFSQVIGQLAHAYDTLAHS